MKPQRKMKYLNLKNSLEFLLTTKVKKMFERPLGGCGGFSRGVQPPLDPKGTFSKLFC
jgi:hypothetical protein